MNKRQKLINFVKKYKWYVIALGIIFIILIIALVSHSLDYCGQFSGSGSYAWGGGYECKKAGCHMKIYNEQSGGPNCYDCDSYDFICY